jgi:hypothetical protein
MLLGRCLCKGIRFEISGTHSKVIVCHCSLCRKTSGISSASYIVTGYDQLTWLSGQELVKSGPKHSFCRECGAHAPDSNPRKTVYMVPAGILELTVGEHIFVGSKAHWDVLSDDGAPRFEEGSSGPPPPRDQIA